VGTRPKLARTLTLALFLASAGSAQADVVKHVAAPPDEYAEELQGFVPGANRLEGRIIAPCCWTQTIDIHGSEISNSLRREIRMRLKNGEAPDTIEASLVERYGQRILAVQPGSQLKNLSVGVAMLMGAGGIGGVFMLLRWRRRGQRLAPKPGSSSADAALKPRDGLDDRLDAELKALDR
jgi:cytochrome c-type biogenesis protein CcmH